MKRLFKIKCNHEWRITEFSNIVQLDDMGYPLMLMIITCEKCGKSEQVWRDVSKGVLDNENIKILKWIKRS